MVDDTVVMVGLSRGSGRDRVTRNTHLMLSILAGLDIF